MPANTASTAFLAAPFWMPASLATWSTRPVSFMLLASRRSWRESTRLRACHPIPFGTVCQGKTHEGPPLRFPYQLAVSAVQTEYRPVPGLERPSLARTGTLRSCIAGPVLTSGTACLRPISRPSFGASSTSTWTPSMRPSSSATIQACVACRWRLEAHRGQAAGAAADVHHAVTVCEAAKLHQQRCQPPAPLSHHLFIGVG